MARTADLGVLLAGVMLATVGAISACVRPDLVLVAVIAAAGAFLAVKPFGRLLIFVVGIMAIFQSNAINATVRAGFVVVIVMLAIPALGSLDRAAKKRQLDLRRFIWPLVTIGVVIGLATVSLLWSPRPVDDWLRDSTTYILTFVAPIYGLDAGIHTTRRVLEWLTLLVGLVGSFSFLVTWLGRRGYPIFGLDQFALASSVLVIPGITMCLVFFYRPGRYRWFWGAAAVVQVGLIAAAGGRSGLIYLVAVLAVFLLGGWIIGRGFLRTSALFVVGLIVGVALWSLTGVLGLQAFLTNRYNWFDNVSLDAVAQDGSGQERLYAYSYMWEAFTRAPMLGNGFGETYRSVATGIVTPGTYTLDTPFVYLAKFGVIGSALLVAALIGLIRAAGSIGIPTRQTRREMGMLLAGSAAMWVAVLPSGAVTEQKGFSVAVALLTALCAAWSTSDRATLAQDMAEPQRKWHNVRSAAKAR